jgi:hypothetical protein
LKLYVLICVIGKIYQTRSISFIISILSKAEHECGLPVAHYRYTRGKTRGYGNLRIQVTCGHKSTQIWVLVLGLRVLATSTCETKVFILFYLLISDETEISDLSQKSISVQHGSLAGFQTACASPPTILPTMNSPSAIAPRWQVLLGPS